MVDTKFIMGDQKFNAAFQKYLCTRKHASACKYFNALSAMIDYKLKNNPSHKTVRPSLARNIYGTYFDPEADPTTKIAVGEEAEAVLADYAEEGGAPAYDPGPDLFDPVITDVYAYCDAQFVPKFKKDSGYAGSVSDFNSRLRELLARLPCVSLAR